jgi:hypothetical protein
MPDQSPQTKQEDVIQFLKQLKLLVANDDYEMVQKNYEAMFDLGIDIHGVSAILLSLTEHEYSEGPMPDHDYHREGDVWVFGHWTGECMIYIKMRLYGSNAVCMSFHEAKWTMTFPFKKDQVK